MDMESVSDEAFEAYSRRLALIETLTDESIDEVSKKEVRLDYCRMFNISERTIRNYQKKYREGGSASLLFHKKKEPSSRIGDERLRAKIVEMIEDLPTRTVPRIRKMLSADSEYIEAISTVSDRTIYRFLQENHYTQKERYRLLSEDHRKCYRQFEAPHSLHLVQGDARDGIWLTGPDGEVRKTYLFGWVDDYSRKILSAKYYYDEKLPRMEDSFKDMILRWGIPEKVYLDNGSVYIAKQFAAVLGDLKIKKIHHKPYQASSKGKIEAIMKTIKREFQEEAQKAGMSTLDELNSALQGWIEEEYNKRKHSTTGEIPNKRFSDGIPEDHRRITDLKRFYNMFLLRETRTVTKYGRIKLCSNQYRAKTAAHGTTIEVRYDPFDLSKVYRFEKGELKEVLETAKINNQVATNIPEEKQKTKKEIFQGSVDLMTQYRERHKESLSNQPIPAYSHIIGGDK